ncbi:MAG: GNAT family protein, partial [bacterium]
MLAHKLTDDTSLAILEPYHAAELYAIVEHNRMYLGHYLSWVARTRCVEDMARHIRHNVNRFAEEGSPYCGIWHRGVLVGAIDLMGIKGFNRCGEIGYWIDEAYQGRGLVSTACAALIDHSFTALGINRMEIKADPANVRSRAIPERFGFTCEGNLRQIINMGDHFADRVVYAMLREDWRGSGQQL